MHAQWQPGFPPEGYGGPSFRRGSFAAAALQDATQLRWHLFRVHPDDTLERLKEAELVQQWNAAESVEFPLQWADDTLTQAGWE